MGKRILIILLAIPVLMMFLFSCAHKGEKGAVANNNLKTVISTDTNLLAKLIDLSECRPVRVKFKYVIIDNSGGSDRISVPAPSDSYLQAVIYFDTATFNNVTWPHRLVSSLTYKPKANYQYDWLDDDVKTELQKADSLMDYWPPDFLTNSSLWDGGYVTLNNKILLELHTQ